MALEYLSPVSLWVSSGVALTAVYPQVFVALTVEDGARRGGLVARMVFGPEISVEPSECAKFQLFSQISGHWRATLGPTCR